MSLRRTKPPIKGGSVPEEEEEGHTMHIRYNLYLKFTYFCV
jgi:hypothetical protein